jgi:hypothetical protein
VDEILAGSNWPYQGFPGVDGRNSGKPDPFARLDVVGDTLNPVTYNATLKKLEKSQTIQLHDKVIEVLNEYYGSTNMFIDYTTFYNYWV